MSVAVQPLFTFENSFVRDLKGLYVPWHPSGIPASAPQPLVVNEHLAAELGVDAEALPRRRCRPPGRRDLLAEGTSPVAQAYAGHQFGGYSPRLGDGRPGRPARRGHRRARTAPRPAFEGVGSHTVRTRWGRQGGDRSDAPRVRDRRSDARTRHPHDPGTGGRGDRRADRPRGRAPRRRTLPESPPVICASARSSTRP